MYMTVAPQTWNFLLACLLGAFLGVCYDLFRILRVAIPPSKTSVFVQDILFAAITFICTFLFLQVITDGALRFFVLLGEFLGFIIYHFTVGVLVLKAATAIIRVIKRVLRFLLLPFVKILRWMRKKIRSLFIKAKPLFNKIRNFVKKSLLFLPHLVYNAKRKKKRKIKKHVKQKKSKKGKKS